MAVFRVKALPAVLEPKSWYLVRPDGSPTAKLFVTGLGADAVQVADDVAPSPVPTTPENMDPGDLTLYFDNGLA